MGGKERWVPMSGPLVPFQMSLTCLWISLIFENLRQLPTHTKMSQIWPLFQGTVESIGLRIKRACEIIKAFSPSSCFNLNPEVKISRDTWVVTLHWVAREGLLGRRWPSGRSLTDGEEPAMQWWERHLRKKRGHPWWLNSYVMLTRSWYISCPDI